MIYKWEWMKELFIALGVAVLMTAGQVINETDFATKDNWDTLAEWRTWGYSLGAAVARAAFVAITQFVVLMFQKVQSLGS